ncbi:Permease [Roseomonas mucosa]|uniref:hypothetical protein n=1 Tax=Roseomonas TaxID=125216 RepID=UPI001866316B|nr:MULTISPECIES: hypothetical protein [Roseomonas]MBS5905443.1 hypothetical protein [Acetobacteraceae bacterium]HWL81630.1 hypothetical protein [Roseomonas sp.]MCG7354708.1 hypothetical protein [Roseomonas mucosa]MDT8291227.1 hypothetical protein [Roseomonas mucosa]MDT8313212.1 hypothetical protein [Roseomonas mucosa]
MLTLMTAAAFPLLGARLLDGFGASTTLAVPCGAAMLNILLVLLPMAFRTAQSGSERAP